ncbi:hypothetical protein K0U00_16720, partial [Paenibacillus sepulcri]|nr:hypothetical protein [Paenibacillus sepulcri]
MYRKGLNKMTVMLMVVSVIASMFLTMGMPKSVYAEEDTINFAGGDGTLENPYKIATVENLRNVTIPSPGAYFQQVANFSLSGNWTPIGSFGGIYDGGGFAIENLTMNSSDLYIGLFSNLSSGAVLDNMRLENFSITATGDDSFVGGLVSFINAGATVANSISNGTISFTAPNNVGGLTGYNEGSISNSESNSLITSSGEVFSAGSLVGTNAGTISGSSGSGSIHSSDSRTAYLGGLVGTNAGTVRTSTSSSLVTGGDAASAGGLVGSNYSSSGIVNDSYSTGNASGKASAVVGGLIGRNTGDINRSYSTGNAHTGSDGMAGGLVGYKANGNIINSFSMGNVSGDGAVFVGGLVGMNNGGDVSYSYSTGGASGGSDSTGGLIGFNQGGTVSNSYFNNAGAATSPGEVFKSAEELKQQSTFSGWDFSTIWRIAEDYTYPSLQWQPYTADEITFIDHRDLTWDSIKGTNSVEDEVTSDLTLPTAGAAGSTITWSVSGGVGLIDTSTGRVTRATDDDHTVTLTATVSRSGGQTQMKDFSLKILEAPNNKPIRNSNVNGTANATVSVNTAYALNLSGIFEDVDGDPLSYKVSVDGAPTIAAAMTYTYTPISAGLVTLVFSASDEESDSDDTYTVSLTGNTVPVRQADVDATDDAAVTVNTPYTLDLATIFEDADSNPLSYNVSVNGAPTTTAAESYTYIPTTAGLVTLIFTANDTNVDSTDTYTVELSVNSLPVRKPNVGATTNAAVTVNTPFTLDLSTIFEDADSNTLTYKVSVDGAAEVTADTAYSYTPTATGLMTLVFKANDGNIDSTETYIINLTGNTVPVRQADVDATDDAVVMVNTPYALDLATIFEDADSNTLSYKVSVDGEAATTAAAAYTYTPTTAGLVTLVFTANDGSIDSTDTYTVELRVNSLPVRNSNVGATANASVTVNTPYSLDLSTIFEDVDSNTLSYKVSVDGEAAITAAAAYTYTPTTIGRVTLVFTANDGSIDSTDTYTVELSVNSLPVRKPNVGATANAAVTVNTPYALDLSTIFEDADSNTLSYKVSVDGEEAITASAAYTYTSTTAGLVTMVFTANDGNIDSTDTYTVELRVNSFPVRKPDVGATVNASIPVNTLYTLDLTTIFEDADGDLLSYKVAADGAPAIATSETYTYTLTTANTVALVFTANDTMVDSTETFTVNLKGNTVPVRKTDVEATADATVTVNTPFVLDLAEIFEDADGNPLTYNVSVNGTAAISAIPAYTYTPGAEGAMTLVFSANDGLADSTDTYTVKLTVSGSSYNNGNGGNGGGESIPMTPEYRVTITGSVGTTLPVEIDEAAGRASIAIGALAEKIFVDDGATVV